MNDKVKTILDELLKLFESGNVPEALSIAVLSSSDLPCSKWSLCNRILLFLSNTSDARGFRQWQQVGRYPKKGTKAVYILSPRHKKMKDDSEEDKVVLTGFHPVPVFRFEDTDGKSLETSDFTPVEFPPLFEVAQNWGIAVDWQAFQGNAYGCYQPQCKQIILATHKESVFFHELAHAAHERVAGPLKNGQDLKQEIIAELTAAVLSHLYGKKTDDGGSYRYIRKYAEEAGKDPYKACLGVISEVEKCLGKVMQANQAMYNVT